MSESIFDVANCQAEEVSPIWVYIEPEAETNLEGSEADACAISLSDVYINPNEDQECIIDGCGTEQNPFKTITWALQMVMPSENNPVTLHLSMGIYNHNDSGETFPISMISNVNLNGVGETLAVIDAQQTSRVIVFNESINNTISNLSITGGKIEYSDADDSGAGIYIRNSNPYLNSLTIYNNEVVDELNTGGFYSGGGGGIYIRGDADNLSESVDNILN